MANRTRKGVDAWGAIRSMIAPELERSRSRHPKSRRRTILEAMHAASVAEDGDGLVAAGESYFALTSSVPPGCYAMCPERGPRYFLGGRIAGRKRSEHWTIHMYHYQVWR